MNQLRVIVSSTRPGRIGPQVAEWVAAQAPAEEWEVQLLDLSDLPFLDEEEHPKAGKYALPHTQRWASEVFESDAIVVVTPQYNRSFPAPIKNAIDMLFAEWDGKPIAVVGYDDLSISEHSNPPLTTIRQNIPLAGKLLALNLIEYLQSRMVTNVSIPVELIVRKSA